MDATFHALCQLVRTIDAEKIPRALVLILNQAADELGPWAFVDADADSRARRLRAITSAMAGVGSISM